MCNKFTVIPVDLRMDRDFKDNIRETKKIYNAFKGSLWYYGAYVLCNISGWAFPGKLN